MEEKKDKFNPNDVGVANGNYFGLPYHIDDADIVIVPVPWDATVSYGKGTARGPEAILDASLQVDLYDEKVPNAWEVKAASYPVSEELLALNDSARESAERVISMLEQGIDVPQDNEDIVKVNTLCERMNSYVYEKSSSILSGGKMPVVIGGEHSVPFGQIRALSEKYGELGILHLDAHADLRKAYEGFEYSHASIMYNTMNKIPSINTLVQVGIRDFCSDEAGLVASDPRICTFTDFRIKERLFNGATWKTICDEIIAKLPENVYVSFDIDALSPEYCPNTGTPVPGGLSFAQADYLLYQLSVSGRKIVGFDLNEVAPGADGEWDANVGARILFKMLAYFNPGK